MKTHGIIYRATAPDGTAYIGATTQRLCNRKAQHKKNKTSSLYAVIAQHGAAVKWEVLRECGSQAELEQAEIDAIAAARAVGIPLFNKQSGGVVGYKHSEMSRAKMSESMTGVSKPPLTPQHREKLSASAKRRWARKRKNKQQEDCK